MAIAGDCNTKGLYILLLSYIMRNRDSGPMKPTLEQFDEILEMLARGARDDNDPARGPWIRASISAAGVKLRTLRFVLQRGSLETPAALLDLGAQIGSLTLYATRLGIKSSAVDLPDFAGTYAKISLKYGVEYRSCDLTTCPLPFLDRSFDYVSYLDVIEHHEHSPKRVLEEIRRVLKPQGCVIVSTPNQASLYNRLRLLAGNTISDPFEYFFETAAQMTPYPGHHREYVRAELRAALVATGFRVLECRVIDDDFGATLWHARQSNGSLPRQLWRFRMHLVVTALGHFWSLFGLPFGRVLWAVGEKTRD